MTVRRTFFFLIGILIGIVLVLAVDLIKSPRVALPVQGTVLLYPQTGNGLLMGIAEKHPSYEVCSAWLNAAVMGASQDTLRSHYVIGECR